MNVEIINFTRSPVIGVDLAGEPVMQLTPIVRGPKGDSGEGLDVTGLATKAELEVLAAAVPTIVEESPGYFRIT